MVIFLSTDLPFYHSLSHSPAASDSTVLGRRGKGQRLYHVSLAQLCSLLWCPPLRIEVKILALSLLDDFDGFLGSFRIFRIIEDLEPKILWRCLDACLAGFSPLSPQPLASATLPHIESLYWDYLIPLGECLLWEQTEFSFSFTNGGVAPTPYILLFPSC